MGNSLSTPPQRDPPQVGEIYECQLFWNLNIADRALLKRLRVDDMYFEDPRTFKADYVITSVDKQERSFVAIPLLQGFQRNKRDVHEDDALGFLFCNPKMQFPGNGPTIRIKSRQTPAPFMAPEGLDGSDDQVLFLLTNAMGQWEELGDLVGWASPFEDPTGLFSFHHEIQRARRRFGRSQSYRVSLPLSQKGSSRSSTPVSSPATSSVGSYGSPILGPGQFGQGPFAFPGAASPSPNTPPTRAPSPRGRSKIPLDCFADLKEKRNNRKAQKAREKSEKKAEKIIITQEALARWQPPKQVTSAWSNDDMW